ncbi:ATPase, T2SS/T4P/T4SS family [Castellaniella sp.]|uniref:ATPase, T2SS/T4P/T4SS family n=1 Tax=Castellaniella sp. TaxID=1955812 RepID=UPI00356B3428
MRSVKLQLSFEDGRQLQAQHALPLLIGRESGCALVLRGWRVARHHARLVDRQGEIWVEDLGSLGGTFVNGTRVATHGPLRPTDELLIGPCLIRLLAAEGPAGGEDSSEHPPPCESGTNLADAPSHADAGPSETVSVMAWSAEDKAMRQHLHDELIAALQLRRHDISHMSHDALRAEATAVLHQLLSGQPHPATGVERDALVRALVDEAVGLGPLEPLLADPDVSEIMVNRHDEVFVERAGRLLRASACFSSEQAVLGIIERIVTPLGRRIDDSSPMVDARLRDGSRVNAVISPIALRGASLTIRKFPLRRLAMQDLLDAGTLDQAMASFLTLCVRHRKNIVVSGGTGSGKTSLLNILSNAIPAGERILTIEDAAELRLNHGHLVSLEARPPNLEGRGRVEIRDLVRNALRMRPDRIVVGECRGAEAFDMLAAMNTGHEGSLTTLHANSPRDALGRLETMILMAGMDLPLAAIREHIAASIDMLVQLVRVADGRRLISAIVQVTGMEAGRIQLQDIYLGKPGPPAVFSGCGLLPRGFEDIQALDPALFTGHTVCPAPTAAGAPPRFGG